MGRRSASTKSGPDAAQPPRSHREYRLAADGGTLFRALMETSPGRRGEPRQFWIEGHRRKMTPQLEKEIAHLLAEALIADYRRQEEEGTLEEHPRTMAPIEDAGTSYIQDLTDRLWAYRRGRFAEHNELFDAPREERSRPPVFTKDCDDWNVIVPLDATKASAVRALIPPRARHKWFRSMKSSQALALSVFGNLKMIGCTEVLETVQSDGGGGPAFGSGPIRPENVVLEYAAKLPGEHTSTSVDVLVAGASTVCVECKLSESEIGPCSRPQLAQNRPGYCDGMNPLRAGGQCPLAARGVKYWNEIPTVVQMDKWKERETCPLQAPYQLVRNILASRQVAHVGAGHALLIYDARNPAFWPSPKGVFETLQGDLIDPGRLRRCSWQTLLAAMTVREELRGLVKEIELKYGLVPWA